ncbi:hypothetical protein [Paenibacillus sp. IHBB 10380]|uniref:hypothetical protein n=1 Tax=Paenibacillus sp. IHBB 10380 TaxID=1566358 RepID=UPI001186B19C|nr:hypothetical protein [Paenibacillus sp. IHBB 10380]
MKEELHIAVANGQRVTVKLHDDEIITGVAEVSTDPKHAKIQSSEGPTWVPYEDIEHVSMIGNPVH